MKLPRFTILQLLGLLTACSLLFSAASIDGRAMAVVCAIFAACLGVSLGVYALFYLLSRLVARLVPLDEKERDR